MTWHNEPSGDEVVAARAAVFLAEGRRALLSEYLHEMMVLRLPVESTDLNQRACRLHASVGHVLLTPFEGHAVHPITGTPHATARDECDVRQKRGEDTPVDD
ncbi:hypothetical protein ACFRJ9_19655 [Paenarthrobacter sp. NPDC056912]|uniref:hypothetical protein n=1 Tax=Paenarthrobacter sp. NPDC056912 TaxID=3345965 RepID=UPI00367097AB